MSKLFYIDVETTGVKPEENGLIQLAGIIEIAGKEAERIDLLMKPLPGDVIEDEALKVIGKSKDELLSYQEAQVRYYEFVKVMGKYIDRYDRGDKFHFIGYNSRFDDSFIRAWFKKLDDPYYGSWFHWPAIDVSNMAALHFMNNRKDLPNFKLMTVAKALGISVEPEKAHDGFYDVEITRQIFNILHQ